MDTYEATLERDERWAFMEGSLHFDERSAVFKVLRDITARLNDLGIPYAVVGGMALFKHGLRRFTEDVDILVTREDLKRIHTSLDGRGYLPPHRFSKNLRDIDHKVKIEFLVTGEFPGDGKPKPVAFPDPQAASFVSDSIRYISLESLIELKLASGMTQPDRIKDIGDVQQLIQILHLPASFANSLNPYVQGKFMELWNYGRKRYITLWRNKWISAHAKSIEEMEKALRDAADSLHAMLADGVVLGEGGDVSDDYAYLVTTDPLVAAKYDMVEESEFWQGDDDEHEGIG